VKEKCDGEGKDAQKLATAINNWPPVNQNKFMTASEEASHHDIQILLRSTDL
jgi:hypothetical protein